MTRLSIAPCTPSAVCCNAPLQATEDLASELLEEDSSEPESELQFRP